MNNKGLAFADFNECLRLDPNFSRAYSRRGWERPFDVPGSVAAIKDYDKAIELDQQDFIAYVGRAYSRWRANRNTDSAISDFTTALLMSPSDHAAAHTYLGRATMLMYKRNYSAALADLTQSIALDPQNASTYSWRGHARYKNGDKAGAFADWAKSISISPSSSEAYGRITDDMVGL